MSAAQLDLTRGRHCGLLLPLFAMPSTRSWGIGEIGDLEPMSAWLRSAGQDLLQILPIGPLTEGQQSPYTSLSALAIDPIFLSLEAVPEFRALGGEAALDASARRRLARVRASPRVDYGAVRRLKEAVLRAAFGLFRDREWRPGTGRSDELRAYVARARWWLDDYALFRALHARYDARAWMTWENGVRTRAPDALAEARDTLRDEVLFHQYLQWLAETQWHAARRATDGLGLLGDLPFAVSADSVDVWARQDEFDLEASVGTPPDAFSATGQDWGLPPYRWEVVAQTDDAWFRQRARRSAELYDGHRIDHVVGFYQTYVRERDAPPGYWPGDEQAQQAQGERIVEVFREEGPLMIVEDLGTIPDFVRSSLARLGVPGYRVLRWERDWHAPGQPFLDPTTYPELSVATSGTHDTPPLAVWWQGAGVEERRAVAGVLPPWPGFDPDDGRFTSVIRDALLAGLFHSGSRFLILPVQDVFGWPDEINVPATVAETNWTFQLPWPVDTLLDEPEASERAAALRAWAQESKRR